MEKAERFLVAEAHHHDARTLRILGRRLFEVIAPDQADAHEAKLLEREERDAAAAVRFTMAEDGHGRVHGRFTLDAVHGAMLKKTLLAIAAPKHRAATDRSTRRAAARDPNEWGGRSASTSSATRPTGSRTPAASPPPSS